MILVNTYSPTVIGECAVSVYLGPICEGFGLPALREILMTRQSTSREESSVITRSSRREERQIRGNVEHLSTEKDTHDNVEHLSTEKDIHDNVEHWT